MNYSAIDSETNRTNFGHIWEAEKDNMTIRRCSFTQDSKSDIVELILLRMIPLNFTFKKGETRKMVIGNEFYTILAQFIEGKFPLKGRYIKELEGLTYETMGREHQRRLMSTEITFSVLKFTEPEGEAVVNTAIRFINSAF